MSRYGLVLILSFLIVHVARADTKAKEKTPAAAAGDVPNFEEGVPSSGGNSTENTPDAPPTKAMLAHPIPSLQETRPGQKDTPVLTLESSIEEAIRSATVVQKAKGDVDITGEQLIQGYAQFLPNLAAVGTANRSAGRTYFYTAQPTIVDSRNEGLGYQLSSTLNIFNGLADLGSLKASLSRKTASDLTLKRAKQEIALDVAQTYLQVVLDSELVRIAKENLVASQARESLLTEQTRVGVRNLADLFRQQAQTSSDEAFLTNAESKERTDELLLLRKLRRDASQNYKIVSPKLEEEAKGTQFDNEDSLVRLAIDNRPDLTASQRAANAAEWDVTTIRAGYFPRLDFGASLGSVARTLDQQLVTFAGTTTNYLPASQASYGDQLAHQVDYTIGFTLTWNIFDRWTTSASIQRAKVQAHNARLDAEDRNNQVVGEIRQAYGDYRAVLQQLESTKKGLLASRKAYEVMQGRYQVGSASFVDLTLAQATLVQAEAARAQALIAFALQTRTLETALGTVAVE